MVADGSVEFENGKEGRLRDFNVADLTHTLLSPLLLFKEFTFTGNITAVAFGCYIFTHSLDRFASNNFGANSCLDGNLKLLTRNQLL